MIAREKFVTLPTLALLGLLATSVVALGFSRQMSTGVQSVREARELVCAIKVKLVVERPSPIEEAPPRKIEMCWAGSGILINPMQGLILTNFHVADASEVVIEREYKVYFLGDEDPVTGTFVRSDRSKDLALIRVPAMPEMPVLAIAATAPKVFTPIWAIGCPYGRAFSATQGIVSATGRKVCLRLRFAQPPYPIDPVLLEGMIQIDAAINPGNSGGGLFTAAGVLAGVVNSGNPRADGIGFAIPPKLIHDFLATYSKKN